MILVAGSANLDFVVRAPHIPAPGETVLGREFKTYPGGKGANQAVACARAGGAPTHMLLALGDDLYARPLEESLNAANVKLHIVRDAAQATGTAFICVSDDAENAITVAPGANAALQAHHLPTLDGVSHLLMQLETPMETVTAYAKAARAKGVRVVLNAAPAQSLPARLPSTDARPPPSWSAGTSPDEARDTDPARLAIRRWAWSATTEGSSSACRGSVAEARTTAERIRSRGSISPSDGRTG